MTPFGVMPCSENGYDVRDQSLSQQEKYLILLMIMCAGSTSTVEDPLLGENGEC